MDNQVTQGRDDRLPPVPAAHAFIEEQFPEAQVAIVAGSFMRGEATPTSDLDLLIITNRREAPFRASFRASGWPIEAFVHTVESYRWYFRSDRERRMPTLAAICAEGVVVRESDGLAQRIKEEALASIAAGPPPLTAAEQEDLRYALTDVLDDLLGAADGTEGLFIAPQVAKASANLLLLINNRWIGAGKWTVRALRRFDQRQAMHLDEALRRYYCTGDNGALVAFAHEALAKAGGPLFEGYYREGRRSDIQ